MLYVRGDTVIFVGTNIKNKSTKWLVYWDKEWTNKKNINNISIIFLIIKDCPHYYY